MNSEVHAVRECPVALNLSANQISWCAAANTRVATITCELMVIFGNQPG
jgi:hypothetical protein